MAAVKDMRRGDNEPREDLDPRGILRTSMQVYRLEQRMDRKRAEMEALARELHEALQEHARQIERSCESGNGYERARACGLRPHFDEAARAAAMDMATRKIEWKQQQEEP